MNSSITLHHRPVVGGTIQNLPSSKSISNRAIILNALAGKSSQLINLSEANDTSVMKKMIDSDSETLDVEDAGTTMRFLTAYYAITGKNKTLTGTSRMKQRPIGLLVEALRKLGAEIMYREQDGFPPVQTKGFTNQKAAAISIRGDVSSQYISALMMIGPTLPLGLHLKFEGKVTSVPYIEMTASLMKRFGVACQCDDKEIIIPHQPYTPTEIVIEPDWSAASYWFAFTALAQQGEVILPDMALRSIQGDRVIMDIMEPLGVKSEPRGNSLLLVKKEHQQALTWNFTNCPDLAQTVAVVCAAKGIHATFTGLESLRIKETDRILALRQELSKIGADFIEEDEKWILTPAENPILDKTTFNTYLDHRMAMAFAPLAAQMDVTIENPKVVDKSYPAFWQDVQSLGFTVTVG